MTQAQEKEIVDSLKSIAASLQTLVTFAHAASEHFHVQQPVFQPPKRQTFGR
jgi:hypothetical protein